MAKHVHVGGQGINTAPKEDAAHNFVQRWLEQEPSGALGAAVCGLCFVGPAGHGSQLLRSTLVGGSRRTVGCIRYQGYCG